MRFSVPSEEGRGPSCSGRHTIVWAVLKSWLQSFVHLPVFIGL